MTFAETAPPEVGSIGKAHPLLELAQRWRRKCRWGGMQDINEEMNRCVTAILSYIHHAQEDFFPPRDYFHLRGQDNLLRHIPAGRLAVCLHPEDSLFETVARLAAGRISGCQVTLIRPPGLNNSVTRFLESEEGRPLLQGVQVRIEDDARTARRMAELDRLRYAAPARISQQIYAAAAQAGVYIARDPVLMDGRVELLHYLLGQSICDNYHRHGNLGERGLAASGP
jgi:RHH-type transcriptional regulator, proline utilization regulon repressor / proline dehydrogenase / delta 1-pyrroline-5-carboxylate dehydrogenase